MADGFVEEGKKNNLKCPDDFSIVAYNERLRPEKFFTSIELDHKTRALEVTSMLSELLENPWAEAKQKFIKSELAIRKSSISFKANATVKCAGDKK